MSKVRRKPAPTFPYSPRYPHPDPLDPFVPLRILRERASSSNASHQFASDNASYGQLNLEQDGFFLSVTPDPHGEGFDVPYPPSSTDNHETLTPPRVWQEQLGGYHSDSPPRTSRPPRSRVKPARESKAYFSDIERAQVTPNFRHQEQDQDQNEKPFEPQHQSRRRSKSVFILRPPSQAQNQDPTSPEPPMADVPPSNASVDVLTSVHSAPKQDMTKSRQYTYDDRQSHGYLFNQVVGSVVMQDSPIVVAHSNARSQRSATPPMTPDDTLSVSSSSVRDRSVSLSPRSLFRDLPRVSSKPVLTAKGMSVEEPPAVVLQETPMTGPVCTEDFPLLQPHSAPPSPEAVPAVLSPSSFPSPSPEESEPEPEREPEQEPEQEQEPQQEQVQKAQQEQVQEARPRRGRVESTGKRKSMHSARLRKTSSTRSAHRQLRKTSSTGSVRLRKSSHPEYRSVPRAPSSSDGSSLTTTRTDAKTHREGPVQKAQASASGAVSTGPSSFPGSRVHAQSFRATPSAVKTVANDANNAGSESDPGPGSKSARFIMHKPKKSLSHVSLGLSALPNVSLGPMPSANTSIGSAMTVGAGFSSVGSISRDDLSRQTHDFALLRPPVPTRPAVEQNLSRRTEKPPAVERNVKRIPSFPVLDEDTLITELQRELDDMSPIDTSTPAFPALTNFERPHAPAPLTPVVSRAPSAVGNVQETHFQMLQRSPTPPQTRTYMSPLPPLPLAVSRAPTPDKAREIYSDSPLPPPRSETPPRFYISPIPPTEILAPMPLPLSPPQQSEPPTPLPLPTPRAKSPVPRPPSRPSHDREGHNVIPAVVRPDILNDSVELARSRSPPVENRPRKREPTARGEERQSTYLPVAQLRPQSQAQTQTDEIAESEPRPQTLARKRISTAQISGPVRQPTPPNQAQRRGNGRSATPPAQSSQRTQTPPAEAQYRVTSPTLHSQPRAQLPPAVPEFRAQSPPPMMPHSRARSPPVHSSSRVQLPSSRAPSRARSPTSSQDHNNRARNHDQSFAQLSRAATAQSATSQSSAPQTRRHGTAPSTPVPQHATPSPAMTTYSQPYPPPRAETRRSRPHTTAPRRNQRHQRSQISMPNLKFDEYAIPSREQLRHAASLFVVAQNGLRVQFGELFKDRKTVVIFIRHFWCPADQDYMYSIARGVDPDALKRANIDLVVVGLGSPAMIRSYKQIFRMPFAIYTDPTLRLHAALGMTRKSQDPGYDTDRGEYVRHGPLGGLAMVVRNAIRVGMPVWEKGGDVSQLGGEFVLGPDLSCMYTHRMKTTRSHLPILHILGAAGIRAFPQVGSDGTSRSLLNAEDEENWMEDRRRSFVRMQARREKRREGTNERWRREEEGDVSYGSDVGTVSLNGCWGTNMSRGESGGIGSGEDVHERETYSEKRPVRNFHIANPEEHHYLPPTPIDEDGTVDNHGWDADVSDLPYLDGIGRNRDESYRLTQEVLAYSFGKP